MINNPNSKCQDDSDYNPHTNGFDCEGCNETYTPGPFGSITVDYDYLGDKIYCQYCLEDMQDTVENSEEKRLSAITYYSVIAPSTLIKDTTEKHKNFCQHEWKQYQGLSEVYNYCTKCDEKQK